MIGSLPDGTKHMQKIDRWTASHRHRAVLSCSVQDGLPVRLIDSTKGNDDLLLRRVCHRHLVIGRHALFMWCGLLSRDFRGNVIGEDALRVGN
jgi:hypothetical protein